MGPQAAFPRLVRAHADAMWTTALRLTGRPADAEDLVQEAFTSAWRAMAHWDDARWASLQPRAFLVTCLLNTWRNGLRTAARRPGTTALTDHDVLDRGPGPADVLDEHERLAELVAALPETYRAPVVLRHVVGLPYSEVAAVLGCPVGTAKAQVSRGTALLRSQLEDPR